MLTYGAKLVRSDQVSGPDLLAFVIYQLTLGSILSVSQSSRRKVEMIQGFSSRIFHKFIHR